MRQCASYTGAVGMPAACADAAAAKKSATAKTSRRTRASLAARAETSERAADDDAELRKLNPVVRRAQRAVDGVHYAASWETSSSVPSAATTTLSRTGTSSRNDRARAR